MADDQLPRVDITPHWATVQRDILRIVDIIPDDRMSWTPKNDLWNFQGILIHIADARDAWMSFNVKDGDPYPNIWTTARSKDDLKRELERTWARLGRFLASKPLLDASHTNQDEHGRDFTVTGHWIAFNSLEHDVHHRAELLQRLALLDIDHGIDI